MLELGEAAVSSHREAGNRVAGAGASWLFAMGTHADDIKNGALAAGMSAKRIFIVETHDEMTATILEKVKSKDIIFLKGSRKMQFEKVSDGLQRMATDPIDP